MPKKEKKIVDFDNQILGLNKFSEEVQERIWENFAPKTILKALEDFALHLQSKERSLQVR